MKDSTFGLSTVGNRLCGYFCSEIIFNLTYGVLTDTEITVLEKGLDFAQIQRKINEPKPRSDFNPLSANPIKLSNKVKKFVGCCRGIFLSV